MEPAPKRNRSQKLTLETPLGRQYGARRNHHSATALGPAKTIYVVCLKATQGEFTAWRTTKTSAPQVIVVHRMGESGIPTMPTCLRRVVEETPGYWFAGGKPEHYTIGSKGAGEAAGPVSMRLKPAPQAPALGIEAIVSGRIPTEAQYHRGHDHTQEYSLEQSAMSYSCPIYTQHATCLLSQLSKDAISFARTPADFG